MSYQVVLACQGNGDHLRTKDRVSSRMKCYSVFLPRAALLATTEMIRAVSSGVSSPCPSLSSCYRPLPGEREEREEREREEGHREGEKEERRYALIRNKQDSQL